MEYKQQIKAIEKASQQLREFIEYLQVEKNASLHTVNSYRADMNVFFAFARLQGVAGEAIFTQADSMLIRAYIASLTNAGYARSTILRRIATLKAFFRFLCKEYGVDIHPFAGIHRVTTEKKVPVFLTEGEMTQLLNMPGNDLLGIRDKAILELLYASGLRVGELIALTVKDVDMAAGYVLVYGKKAKERLVPIGRISAKAIADYLADSRLKLCEKCKTGRHESLFVNAGGSPLTDRSVRRIVSKYAEKLALQKQITPQTLRYTAAAHLLQNGADFLFVQEILGQVDAVVTQFDVPVTRERLKSVYKGAHPRA